MVKGETATPGPALTLGAIERACAFAARNKYCLNGGHPGSHITRLTRTPESLGSTRRAIGADRSPHGALMAPHPWRDPA
jgi:hypothetical protein